MKTPTMMYMSPIRLMPRLRKPYAMASVSSRSGEIDACQMPCAQKPKLGPDLGKPLKGPRGRLNRVARPVRRSAETEPDDAGVVITDLVGELGVHVHDFVLVRQA